MHGSKNNSAASQAPLEVFFDGLCPMCAREIKLLRSWDSDNRIKFTDIAAEDFDPAPTGKSLTTLMRQIHARTISSEFNNPDSTKWFIGVDVFRQMYGRIGFEKSVWVSRLPVFREMLTLAYKGFAAVRLSMAVRRMDKKTTCQQQNCHDKSSTDKVFSKGL